MNLISLTWPIIAGENLTILCGKCKTPLCGGKTTVADLDNVVSAHIKDCNEIVMRRQGKLM